MYKIIVDDQHEFDSTQLEDLDAIADGISQFHILHNNKAYRAEIFDQNPVDRKYAIRVNGTIYQVAIKDEFDLLAKKLGLSATGTQQVKDIKAPMPGLVLEIMAEVGQTVEKGTPLLILEAMKMENVIKAHGEGVVKAINVEKRQAVDKGQLLMEME